MLQLLPWLSSKPLNEAMADETCGCILVENSYKETDPEVAEVLKTSGEEAAKCWNCPNFGFLPSKEKLTAGQKESLEIVQKLTGADTSHFETCPRSYFNKNTEEGKDCERVINARTWRDKGQLQLIYPSPSLVLVEAIDTLDNAVMAFESYNTEKRIEKMKKDNKELDEKYNNRD